MLGVKKILNSIWNEFVYGGHLLSLGACSIVFTTIILLKQIVRLELLIIVYLGCHLIYLYNRYKEYQKDFLTNPERTSHVKKYFKYLPIIIYFYAILFFALLIYNNTLEIFAFAFSLLLVGVLFSEFFKGVTKKIIGFKDFYSTFFWALLVIFTGVYYSIFNLALFLFFIFAFLMLFVNINFCDIKDIESDRKEKLLTPAAILGREKLLKILSFITIFAVIPIVLGLRLNVFPKSFLMLLLIIPYTFWLFKKSEDIKINLAYFTYVFVYGEYVLWSLLILLGEILL